MCNGQKLVFNCQQMTKDCFQRHVNYQVAYPRACIFRAIYVNQTILCYFPIWTLEAQYSKLWMQNKKKNIYIYIYGNQKRPTCSYKTFVIFPSIQIIDLYLCVALAAAWSPSHCQSLNPKLPTLCVLHSKFSNIFWKYILKMQIF